MVRFTRWVLRHKLLVALFWLTVTGVGILTVAQVTAALSKQFTGPGREGYETNQAILHTYGFGPEPIVLVVTLPDGITIDSPGIHDQLAGALSQVGAAVPGTRIVSYSSTSDRAFVSQDGRTTFALVDPPLNPMGYDDGSHGRAAVQTAVRDIRVAGAPLHITGIAVLWSGGGSGGGPDLLTESLIGGLGALLVLAFVFGSFLAAVPLLMAVPAIMGTFLLVWGITTLTDVSFIVQFLIGLIGLGVAIDYSLLIVVRWREEREAGWDNAVAVERAMETAGMAVIHSGTTVAVGLLALVVLPVPFLRSIGFGGMLIPLVSVAVAITLLPVVLVTVGPRLDWPRHSSDAHVSRAWAGWASLVIRRRGIAAGIALLILGALLVPAFSLNLGEPQADALATGGDARDGVVALEESGIGTGVLTPIYALATPTEADRVMMRLAQVSGVRAVIATSKPSLSRTDTTLITIIPTADANSPAGRATLKGVRQAAHTGDAPTRIGGDAADSADFIAAVYDNFPLMLALIALVTYLLLVRAFRSLLLPLKAVLLNVLSVGGAWGILVLVWQRGFGAKLFWGIDPTDAITAWVPLMVFAFLFGLSMDYEVFIMARMREEYDRTGSTNDAVVEGIGRTGRLVTCAALILTFAFISMASAPVTDIKILATGLAAGILLDATVIRALLVPALVSLMGEWNWWLPTLPARLLRVTPSLLPHDSLPVDATPTRDEAMVIDGDDTVGKRGVRAYLPLSKNDMMPGAIFSSDRQPIHGNASRGASEVDGRTENIQFVRDEWLVAPERGVLGMREVAEDRAVPFALWRIATVSCLLFLIYPLRELLGMPPAPARLFVALAGMVVFVSIYLWLMLREPFRVGPLAAPEVRRHVLLLVVLVAIVLFLTVTYSATWLWFVLYANSVAGMKLPVRVATITILSLTLLVFGVAAATIGWHAIDPAVSTVISVSILMIGASRLVATIQDLRTARQEIAHLAVAEAVAEERLRFARDLHDLLGHSLSAITLKNEVAHRLIRSDPDRTEREIEDAIATARAALREVREAVSGYRQPVLATEIGRAREILAAAAIVCRCEDTIGPLPRAVESVLAWAVREGVTNVVRHSHAGHCIIHLMYVDDTACVEIIDDGDDTAPILVKDATAGASNGLRGLAERVAQQDGHLDAGPDTTGGFRLRVTLPMYMGAHAADGETRKG